MKEKHPAELLLEKELGSLHASNATFYIRDPYWTHDLRLASMPNVKTPEPMHGFLIPDSARRMVTSGDDEMYFTHDADWTRFRDPTDFWSEHLTRFNKLFGNFVEREGIKRSARFIHRKNGQIESVLFVNFADESASFDLRLRAQLKSLAQDMVQCIPSIRRNILHSAPFPVSELLRVLQPFERLTTIFHDTTSPSLETYLESMLFAAMEACGISLRDGFGTVHLYDPAHQILRLVAYKGVLTEDLLQASQELSIPARRGVVSWVALKRRALLIEDLPQSPFRDLHVQVRPDIVAEMAVPMTAGDEVLGVFNIEASKHLQSRCVSDLLRIVWYAANQAAIACRFSNQVAIARHQAGLARTSAYLSEQLLKVCSDTPLIRDAPRPLAPVAGLASGFLKADRCDIWQYDPIRNDFRGVGADYDDFHPNDPPRPDGWSRYIHDHQRAIWLSSVSSQIAFSSLWWNDETDSWIHIPPSDRPPTSVNQRLLELRVGSELGVPIRLGNRSLGVLWMKFNDPHRLPPSEEVVQSARGFAGQAAMILSCLQHQETQETAAHAQGIELILKVLRHDIPDAILGHLIKGLQETDDTEAIRKKRDSWLLLLRFLRAFIEQLQWYKPASPLPYPALPSLAQREIELVGLLEKAAALADIIDPVPKCSLVVSPGTSVYADEILLMLALFTVIHNAKKFTPQERSDEPVIIEAITCGSRVEFAIKDNGFGIPEDILQLLGEAIGIHHDPPGTRLRGMGFGTYLCGLLVYAQGGKVTWENGKKGGATVRFSLPARRP